MKFYETLCSTPDAPTLPDPRGDSKDWDATWQEDGKSRELENYTHNP